MMDKLAVRVYMARRVTSEVPPAPMEAIREELAVITGVVEATYDAYVDAMIQWWMS